MERKSKISPSGRNDKNRVLEGFARGLIHFPMLWCTAREVRIDGGSLRSLAIQGHCHLRRSVPSSFGYESHRKACTSAVLGHPYRCPRTSGGLVFRSAQGRLGHAATGKGAVWFGQYPERWQGRFQHWRQQISACCRHRFQASGLLR